MFSTTQKKGRFVNSNGFIIDFNHLTTYGYYFIYEREKQIKKYLKDVTFTYVLEHWNKPANNCALWDSKTNIYVTPNLPEIKQPFSNTTCFRMQMTQEITKPTYVLYYPNSHLEQTKDRLWDIVLNNQNLYKEIDKII